ncbi:MAG: hypothetical protein AB1733_11765 [Thermodesulfobacteriota bacterium]
MDDSKRRQIRVLMERWRGQLISQMRGLGIMIPNECLPFGRRITGICDSISCTYDDNRWLFVVNDKDLSEIEGTDVRFERGSFPLFGLNVATKAIPVDSPELPSGSFTENLRRPGSGPVTLTSSDYAISVQAPASVFKMNDEMLVFRMNNADLTQRFAGGLLSVFRKRPPVFSFTLL